MITKRFTSTLPHPRDAVWQWHGQRGALRRMLPPFLGHVTSEPETAVDVGARTAIRLRGLPPLLRTWDVRCTDVVPQSSFTDVQESGPMASWTHTHSFEELDGATRLTDNVEFSLPLHLKGPVRSRVLDIVDRVFTYRHAQLRDDLAFLAAHRSEPLRVALSGASGLIGSNVSSLLTVSGHEVIPIVRAASPVPGTIAMSAESSWVDTDALDGVDVIVHLAGAPIAGRFTDAHKRAVRDSRIVPTSLLARAAASVGTVKAFVSASAIGYYGAVPDGTVTEDSPRGADFLAEVVHEWEEATRPAEEAGIRTVQVRTGLVLSPDGGALPLQLPLFRAFLGGPLARGTAWQSWISIDDAAGVFAHAALDPDVAGPLNSVAPTPVTTAEFASGLGDALSRPSLIGVPKIGPELLLGKEGAELMAHASQKVSSSKLARTGYRFRHPQLSTALEHIL